MLGRYENSASAPVDLAKPPGRLANGRRIDDGQKFLEMITEHTIEQLFVAVLKIREGDVFFEVCVLELQHGEHALALVPDIVDLI